MFHLKRLTEVILSENRKCFVMPKPTIKKASGRLGILIPGMGAVTTTFMAGVEAIRKKYSHPVGSLTQIGRIRLGRRDANKRPFIKDVIPLANFVDIEFLAWDVFPENAYESALKHGVLNTNDLDFLKDFLKSIQPVPAVFDKKFVKKLNGDHIKRLKNHREHIASLKEDIAHFKKEKNIDRMVMIWAGSTEVFSDIKSFHADLNQYEKALDENHPEISPSQIYAYTALSEGIPYLNGAPQSHSGFPCDDRIGS